MAARSAAPAAKKGFRVLIHEGGELRCRSHLNQFIVLIAELAVMRTG